MPETPGTTRTITVVGAPDAMSWVALYAAGDATVRFSTDPADLAGADEAFVAGSPDGVARATEVLGGSPQVPATLFLGPSPHPHLRAFKAFCEGKQQWEAIFDAILEPIALLDAEGIVRRANRGFAAVCAQPVALVCGRPYAEVLGLVAEGPDPIALCLADGERREAEVRFEGRGGLYHFSGWPVRAPGAAAQGLAMTLADVTDDRRRQERLAQANRLADVGQLAAGVAHEINTPLASILLRAERLLRDVEAPPLAGAPGLERFSPYLRAVVDDVFRCKRIIEGLLEFARPRARAVQELALGGLAEKAAALLAHEARKRRVTLAVEAEADLPAADGDEAQLAQVMIALLMNALDAVGPGGVITVRIARAGGDRVSLEVKDDGQGMTAEVREKAMSPFFTTKPVGQGTGLGLSVSQGIVSAHGGEIRIESQPGQGTTVTVLLPLRKS